MIFFPNSERKKDTYPCANCQKMHRLERAQYAFLDRSKALVFSDVIKNRNSF